MARDGMRTVFGLERHVNILRPGMFVEISADHLAVFGPFVKRIGRAMDSQEELARLDPIEQSLLLRVGERQFASRVEDDHIQVFHVLRRQLVFGHLRDRYVETVLSAELFHYFFGQMQDLVAEALTLRDKEQARLALRRDCRRCGRGEAEFLLNSLERASLGPAAAGRMSHPGAEDCDRREECNKPKTSRDLFRDHCWFPLRLMVERLNGLRL